LVEADIGIIKHLLGCGSRWIQVAYADAERDGDLKRFRDLATHPFGNGHRGSPVGLRHEDCKLVTSQSADYIRVPGISTQSTTDCRQDVVTDEVPISVIHEFEVVEVDQQKAKSAPVAT
jgi:hypothetical protein